MFSLQKSHKYIMCRQKVCDALHYHYDIIFIRVCSILYRQIVGIPMCANCAHFIAVLFVMRETSCCLYLTIIKLGILKHSTILKISR